MVSYGECVLQGTWPRLRQGNSVDMPNMSPSRLMHMSIYNYAMVHLRQMSHFVLFNIIITALEVAVKNLVF